MGAKGYTQAQMAEAIALAVVVGADTAGERLHIQPKTIRRWCERAGRKPADAISTADWSALGEMARAQVQADLMAGRLTPVQAATVAGIADRNREKVVEAPPESAVTALDGFLDWLLSDDIIDTLGLALTEDGFDSDDAAIDALRRELIRRANAEPGQPHRPAQLAWFSNRPEVEAGDVLEWARAQTEAILAEHGSLAALREWEAAQRAEREAAVIAQLAANRAAADAWARQSLDAETAAILAEADAWLEANR